MSWEIRTFIQTFYHRFCQVKPNLSPSRYSLAISGYNGDFVEIFVTRCSVDNYGNGIGAALGLVMELQVLHGGQSVKCALIFNWH